MTGLSPEGVIYDSATIMGPEFAKDKGYNGNESMA